MMSILREEIATTASHAITTTTTTTVATSTRTGLLGGAAGKTALREASTLATRTTTTESSTTLFAPLSRVMGQPPAATQSSVQVASAVNTTIAESSAGMLTRMVEPDLSLTVKEAMSQASQQGLEETADKLTGPDLQLLSRFGMEAVRELSAATK